MNKEVQTYMYTKRQFILLMHAIHPLPVQFYLSFIKQAPPYIQSRDEGWAYFKLKPQSRQLFTQKWTQLEKTNYLDTFQMHDITPIMFTDSLYPPLLRHIPDPPTVLYTKGNCEQLLLRSIAVVGSRKASRYTYDVLTGIHPEIKKEGYQVVSGLASGADTFAHQLAIQSQIPTIAVLAHGFSTLYPLKNTELAQEIAKHHLLITEYPYEVQPERWRFLSRNRIVSGMSELLFVTEAEEKSGTSVTVGLALEQGREVMAVPGPVNSSLSKGTHLMIEEGAIPLISKSQFRDLLGRLKENHRHLYNKG